MSDDNDTPIAALPPDKRIGLAMAEALDNLWSKVMGYHPDMPEVALFVSPVAHGGDTATATVLGHFGADRWRVPGQDKPVGELLLVAEQMMRGPECLLETVLHESAHAMAHARGVEDTSQNGRYHNARFKETAEEVGLVVSAQGGRGLAHTELADGTLERYADEVVAVGKALVELDKARPKREKGPKRPGPLKVTCACPKPRIFRISPQVLAVGDITCGVCLVPFSAHEPGADGGDGGGEA